MANLKKDNYLQFLFILSFAILTTAYAIQYIFGYQPCNLCIIERIPYVLAMIILIFNYNYQSILIDNLFHFSVLQFLCFVS